MPWYLALTVPFLTPDELGALLFAVRAPPLSRAPWVSIDIGGVVFWSGGFVRPLVAPSIGTWTLPAAASAAGTVWRLQHIWLCTTYPCAEPSKSGGDGRWMVRKIIIESKLVLLKNNLHSSSKLSKLFWGQALQLRLRVSRILLTYSRELTYPSSIH